MRARMILILLASIGWLSPLNAQVRKFPYDARVVVDEVYVRSGSGNNSQYYATQKLSRDAVVTVRRHEPGGWLMIDPPQGSFSWVPAKHVERNGDEGTVSEDNSVAFVGSDFGDEAGVWQRPLRSGERVRILGEKEIDTHSGMQLMYRIEPPSREFRWVPGTAVVPIDDEVRRQMDNDPYAMPSQAKRTVKPPQQENSLAGVVDAPEVSPSPQLVRLQTIRAEQKALAEIDSRFRSMLRDQPNMWDLEELEEDYRSLQDRVTYRPVAGQIDLRFPAIERYRQRKAKFEDFKRLTSQTEERESQLLAAQYNPMNAFAAGTLSSTEPSLASNGPTSMMSAGIPPNLAQLFAGLDGAGTTSQPAGAFADTGVPSFPESPVASSQSPSTIDPATARSRYVGAGIITRAQDEAAEAPYVLTSPTGQILAHVKPDDGVDVEAYVGQSVGLHGSRWFKDDIKSDYITVSGLEPVRLR